ncbi:hypothetical protein XYCOK13_21360 [Xylanibacillus composti]|uniref:Uncharacterized protein n=1 Tax=Xylanibacillus composti TaxID=1572762 RepID=A0A8J4H4F0_9BACL|nr:hypothetical protein XYCOK13_21360 [Xylanibacillus composti]
MLLGRGQYDAKQGQVALFRRGGRSFMFRLDRWNQKENIGNGDGAKTVSPKQEKFMDGIE